VIGTWIVGSGAGALLLGFLVVVFLAMMVCPLSLQGVAFLNRDAVKNRGNGAVAGSKHVSIGVPEQHFSYAFTSVIREPTVASNVLPLMKHMEMDTLTRQSHVSLNSDRPVPLRVSRLTSNATRANRRHGARHRF
jgi:hypothetical protein